jgi:hypothetical protein
VLVIPRCDDACNAHPSPPPARLPVTAAGARMPELPLDDRTRRRRDGVDGARLLVGDLSSRGRYAIPAVLTLVKLFAISRKCAREMCLLSSWIA